MEAVVTASTENAVFAPFPRSATGTRVAWAPLWPASAVTWRMPGTTVPGYVATCPSRTSAAGTSTPSPRRTRPARPCHFRRDHLRHGPGEGVELWNSFVPLLNDLEGALKGVSDDA